MTDENHELLAMLDSLESAFDTELPPDPPQADEELAEPSGPPVGVNPELEVEAARIEQGAARVLPDLECVPRTYQDEPPPSSTPKPLFATTREFLDSVHW